jgi:pimeloyl-ACP methyl ester carboxylesterase
LTRVQSQHTLEVDGTKICVFESGTRGAQQVLLVHATGFHARCWDKVSDQLPDDWHVLAVDLRGHGRSDNNPPFTWDRFAEDLLVVCAHFGVQNAIGVGHSLGGHCVAHICALQPDLFEALVLVDPVIFAPQMYSETREQTFMRVEDHPVAKRRSHFASWQAMFERFEDRLPYSLWQPDILRDYCEYGVLPADSGDGVDLACPGIVEASVYFSNFDTDIYPLLKHITQPVSVLRAKPRDEGATQMDFSASPTWPELAGYLPNAKDIYLPELTHFIPMQRPDLVADYILAKHRKSS